MNFDPQAVAPQARRGMAVCGRGIVIAGAIAALAACMGRPPMLVVGQFE
jgi:NAD(P)H-hydrate repair Nnr-like enzyme with NAD(P)H-hydrate dehydratase domain